MVAQWAKMAVASMKLQVFCWYVLLPASGSGTFLGGTEAVDPWLGHSFQMLRHVHGPKVFTRRVCPAPLSLVGFESELSFS